MLETREYTLTSKVGKFTFDNEVPFTMAKLVRDTVMSAIMTDPINPPVTQLAAISLIQGCQGTMLAGTRFGFCPAGAEESKLPASFLKQLRDRATRDLVAVD